MEELTLPTDTYLSAIESREHAIAFHTFCMMYYMGYEETYKHLTEQNSLDKLPTVKQAEELYNDYVREQ